MNEKEWQTANAGAMLCFLCNKVEGGTGHWRPANSPTDRKLRLFACAAGRVLARNPRNFSMYTPVERDHLISAVEGHADTEPFDPGPVGFHPEGCYLFAPAELAARHVAHMRVHAIEFAHLLRDIVGNPFRPVLYNCEKSRRSDGVCWRHDKDLVRVEEDVWLCPSSRAYFDRYYRTPDVLALAQAVYEERELPAGTLDLTRLAILTDALEELGCTDAGILDHLRSSGPHVRGCHVLDLVLRKERA